MCNYFIYFYALIIQLIPPSHQFLLVGHRLLVKEMESCDNSSPEFINVRNNHLCMDFAVGRQSRCQHTDHSMFDDRMWEVQKAVARVWSTVDLFLQCHARTTGRRDKDNYSANPTAEVLMTQPPPFLCNLQFKIMDIFCPDCRGIPVWSGGQIGGNLTVRSRPRWL